MKSIRCSVVQTNHDQRGCAPRAPSGSDNPVHWFAMALLAACGVGLPNTALAQGGYTVITHDGFTQDNLNPPADYGDNVSASSANYTTFSGFDVTGTPNITMDLAASGDAIKQTYNSWNGNRVLQLEDPNSVDNQYFTFNPAAGWRVQVMSFILDRYPPDGGGGGGTFSAEWAVLVGTPSGLGATLASGTWTSGGGGRTTITTTGAIGAAGQSITLRIRHTQGSAYYLAIDDLTFRQVADPDPCGNGRVVAPQACDDDNTVSSDGCSSTCTVEPGYVCSSAEPSVCSPVCFLSSRSALGNSVYVRCDGGPFKTWANGNAYCRSLGGHLARVDGIDEQYHLTRTGGLVGTTGGPAWMGGNDLTTEGTWHWSSLASNSAGQFWTGTGAGSPVGGLYTQWANAEPNNNGGAGGGQQCGRFSDGDLDRRWDDEFCTNNLPFICELPNVCGDGFRGSTETCDDGNLTGGDGCSSFCTVEGPATCGNARIQGAETCDDGNTADDDGCSSACAVERGWVCPGALPIYDTTASAACSRACGLADTSYFSRFPMTEADLAAEVALQSDAASVEYMSCAGAQNAYDARDRCRSFGTGWDLLRVNSVFEGTLLGGLIGASAWTGGTDEYLEGTFVWRDGAALSPTNWQMDEPNNASNREDCVELYASGTWNDVPCRTAQRYVCEGPSFCGNGAVAMPEACDKGALNGTGVGCTATCTVTPGYGCALPGGQDDGDPDFLPGMTACGRTADGSCCQLAAQAIIGDVRVVGGELEWSTLSEAGTLGFHVSVQQRGAWRDLHEGVLPALPEAGQGAVYRLRASSLRGQIIRIVEHELGGQSLVVYEGTPRFVGGAATLGREAFGVTANALTGAPEMAVDAPPSEAGRRKAAGDEPTGVFALADGEGLLRVTFAELAEALQVPVSAVAAHVAEGELSVREHGNAVAWAHTAGDPTAIVFAARRRESVYSATRPYEVRLTSGVQLVPVDAATTDAATGEGRLRFHHEVDSFPAIVVSPDPTQEFWFERSLGNHDAFREYEASFTVDDVDGGSATFDLSYYAAPGLSSSSPMTLTASINGEAAGTADVSSAGLGVARFTLPAGALLAGPNRVLVRATSALPAGTALAYVDAYQVTFGAPLEFGAEGRFEAAASGALAFELDVADGEPVWIVDVTRGERITATRAAIDASRARFTFEAAANHEYFVASEAGLRAPAGLRARSEQHFDDPSRAADYVVIAPAALLDTASALAARRETQGLSAAVVDVQDIYDAFGHGEHDPRAIREFLRVAQATWSTAPRYVLLLGDGNYDYRGVRPSGSGTIPPMLVRTDRGVYASDAALTDTDGDGWPNLAIGRVPAHTAAEADAFVQRVVAYESADLDAFGRHALLVSGINRGADFTGYVDTLEAQLDTRIDAERIDRGRLSLSDARVQLIDGINAGSFWFHYHGHGASTQLDDDGLLTLTDVAGLTNAGALTIMTGMSCSTARFEVPGMDSISELLLNGSPGGAIALFGPSGAGQSHESGNIAEAWQRNLLTGSHLTDARIGDVVMSLHDEVTGAAASRDQLAVYLLLGDPATQLPDRSRLAPPPVVEPGDDDAGVSVPGADAGERDDAGRPTTPHGPATPEGVLGGGACTVGLTSGDGTSHAVWLLALVFGLGRHARRRSR